MPEGDEVAEPREVFWAEAKQSPEQKEGRGTSQVDGKMEAQTKSGEQERRGSERTSLMQKQARLAHQILSMMKFCPGW